MPKRESNPRPLDCQSNALPAALCDQSKYRTSMFDNESETKWDWRETTVCDGDMVVVRCWLTVGFCSLCVMLGYRSVQLKNGYSEEMELTSLLVHVDIRNPKVCWLQFHFQVPRPFLFALAVKNVSFFKLSWPCAIHISWSNAVCLSVWMLTKVAHIITAHNAGTGITINEFHLVVFLFFVLLLLLDAETSTVFPRCLSVCLSFLPWCIL